MSESSAQPAGITQQDMVHRLPQAQLVDRVDFLVDAARNNKVVHVGFVDSGCWEYHNQFDSWLHAHLDSVASELVGLDLDSAGVERAREMGFAAHAVDCSDSEAVAALGLEPMDVAIAGEIIEHLDDSGSFLDGLHSLVRPGGTLIVTTPNASGLLNAGAAALANYEVNHPDHVTLYSCYTLTNLLERHGWSVDGVATYVPTLKEFKALKGKMKILGAGAQAVLGTEKLLAKLGRPFSADGLIVVARRPD
ncbi:MAG: methyltransferase domain-containing protein [Microthrixaceae bacterium]|nr:methyltransferase domain-containing protein [Microthrixaceae bacterium]